MRILSLWLLIFVLNTTTSVAETKSQCEKQVTSFLSGLRVEDPNKAVELWILGVKNRSGAVQFAMLSSSLKQKSRAQYEKRGWGTGHSSPWVDNFQIESKEILNDTKVKFTVSYNLHTSYANFGKWKKVITVEKNESPYTNWLITEIKTEYNQWEAFTPGETVIKSRNIKQ